MDIIREEDVPSKADLEKHGGKISEATYQQMVERDVESILKTKGCKGCDD